MFLKVIGISLAIIGIGIAGYGLRIVSEPATPRYFVVEVTPNPSSEPSTPPQEITYDRLVEQVAPLSGTTIEVDWGDMGQKLLEAGAIDFEKLEALYGSFSEEQLEILQGNSLDHITFTPENIQFWTNVLWALGLTQESKVLLEGPMKQNENEFPLGNYASTGGWTIGSKSAVELYASARLIELTPEQDDLVYSVAENVFRPCCGNHTAYPDCNHGMALLGLLELMSSQGAREEELYQAALIFNSYAFRNTYVYVAAYFALQGVDWSEVDRQRVLGYEFSSGRGAQWVASQVQQVPGTPTQSGSCSPE